eukprot:3804113-Prymnesium_polylepis.1
MFCFLVCRGNVGSVCYPVLQSAAVACVGNPALSWENACSLRTAAWEYTAREALVAMRLTWWSPSPMRRSSLKAVASAMMGLVYQAETRPCHPHRLGRRRRP